MRECSRRPSSFVSHSTSIAVPRGFLVTRVFVWISLPGGNGCRPRNLRTPDNRRGAQYPLLDILDDFGPPRSEKKTDIWAKIAGKSEEKSDIWAQIGRFQERVAQWLSVDKIESDHEFEPASQKSDFKAVDAARGENHEKMRPQIEFLKVNG